MTRSDDSAPRRRLLVTELAQRVTSGLHLGLLRYGDRLPSARELAQEFDTDRRVVLAAYRVLAERGMVELRPRSGIYVARPAGDGASRTGDDGRWMVDLLEAGLRHGVPAPDMAERARRAVETLRLRAVVFECNDDQLFSVSDELERDYGLEVTAVDLASVDTDGRAHSLALRRADCVVTTLPHGEFARRTAEATGVPALVLAMCADLFAEVRRLLVTREVHFVVVDPRFERKLRASFADAPGAERLRVHVIARDDLAAIPRDAPTYLTRLARRTVGDVARFEHVIPEARVFSEPSMREVLEFVVRANLAAMQGKVASG